MPVHVPDRGILRTALILALLHVVLALFLVCPTVPPGDSGELIAVAVTRGVAHAPGYPLYTLMAHIAARLPFGGEPALGVNLLSAVLQGLAVGVVLVTIFRLTGSRIAALAGGLALSLSRVFLHYSLVAEVFPLNNLLAAILLDAAVVFMDDPANIRRPGRRLAVAAFAAAGVVTHHTTLVIVAAPVAALLGWRVFFPRRIGGFGATALRRRAVPAGLAGVAAGLLPLLYLPLAARGDPLLNWDDPRDAAGIARILTRADYGSFDLVSRELVEEEVLARGEAVRAGLFGHGLRHVAEIPRNFPSLAPVLMAAGLLALRRRPAAAVLLGGSVLLLALFYARVNAPLRPLYMGVVDRFRMLPDILLAILAGLGAGEALGRIARRIRSPGPRRALVAAILAAVALPPLALNVPAVDQSGNTFCRELGRNVLAALEPDALLFQRGDLMHNALAYVTLCLGERPDVVIVDMEKLTYAWHLPALRRAEPRLRLPEDMVRYDGATERWNSLAWVRLNLPGRPVSFFRPKETSFQAEFTAVPRGLVERIFRRGTEPGFSEELEVAERLAASMELGAARRIADPRSFESAEAQVYGWFFARLAFLREVADLRASGGRAASPPPSSREALDAARTFAPDPPERAAILTDYAWRLALVVDASAPEPRSVPRAAADHVYRRAAGLYEEAIRTSETACDAMVNLHYLRLQVPALHDPARAAELIERAVAVRPWNLQILKIYAERALAAGDPAAIRLLGAAASRALAVHEERARRATPDGRRALEPQIAELRRLSAEVGARR